MTMVIVACDHAGCDFGALYVVPAEPAWPSYEGSHQTQDDDDVHDHVRVLTADYGGDPADARAMLDWANGVLEDA